MNKIKIIAVGKLKERYWREAVAEYLKRLGPYAKVEVVEIQEEKEADNASAAEIKQVLTKEGERIEKHLNPSCFVIPLAIEGSMFSSEKLAAMMERLSLEGKSQVSFIIGGSHGLAPQILDRGDFLLSFSPVTFPHQMMRVLLLEQIYRAYKISKGEPYHK